MPRLTRRILAGLVSAALLGALTVPSATAADAFADIADSYAREAITALHAQGKVDGVGGGLFAPKDKMTREQYAKLLVLAMEKAAANASSPFGDNEDPAAWYYGYVNAANANGFMIGLDSQTFGVGQPISREQAVITIVRAAGLEDEVQPSAAPTFSDAAEISPWARGYVALAEARSLVVGMGDGTFQGGLEMTREMAVQMLYRALESAADEAAIRAKAGEVLTALEQADPTLLASLVHPTKGVRFSPYSFVRTGDDGHLVFTPNDLNAVDPTQVYTWGFADGTGRPVEMTFAQYLQSGYVYGKDYRNAPVTGFDRLVKTGNTIVNIQDAYPDGHFVEFHFPGTPQNQEMDWSSLRLVFEETGGQWYLVGVVSDQWTV